MSSEKFESGAESHYLSAEELGEDLFYYSSLIKEKMHQRRGDYTPQSLRDSLQEEEDVEVPPSAAELEEDLAKLERSLEEGRIPESFLPQLAEHAAVGVFQSVNESRKEKGKGEIEDPWDYVREQTDHFLSSYSARRDEYLKKDDV